MTFPTSPNDCDTHVENGKEYYALNGRWQERLPMYVSQVGGSDLGSSGDASFRAVDKKHAIAVPPPGIRAKKLVILNASWSQKNLANAYLSFFTQGSWFNASHKFDGDKPTGMFSWGDGGAQSGNWEAGRAWDQRIWLYDERDRNRMVKPHRSCFLEAQIFDANTFSSMMYFTMKYQHNNSSCGWCSVRTSLGFEIRHIEKIKIGSENSQIEDGRITVEWY